MEKESRFVEQMMEMLPLLDDESKMDILAYMCVLKRNAITTHQRQESSMDLAQ